MEVLAVGKPKPDGKWFKQGEEIIPSKEFIIENLEDGTSILTITESYPDDTGEIVFEAHNPLGVAVTSTQLLIETTEGKFCFDKTLLMIFIIFSTCRLPFPFPVPHFFIDD